MPKVSIILPNFNHEKYLIQRLDSIFNQTYRDFEVILLDDNSTDGSWGILSAYARHAKVSHLIENDGNSGSPFKQWQKGITLAKGKFIWIAESDDWADPSFLESVIPFMEGNKQIGLVYVKSKLVAPDGTILKDYQYSTIGFNKKERWNNNYENNGKEEIKYYLNQRNIIPNASAVVFQRKLLPKDMSFIKKFKLIGDWLLWIKILEKSNVFYLAESLNYFRMSENNSRRHNSIKKKMLRVIEEIHLKKYLRRKKYLSKRDYDLYIRNTFIEVKKIIGKKKILSFVVKHIFLFSVRDYLILLDLLLESRIKNLAK